MRLSEIERLGRSVKYPFYSIFKAVSARPEGGLSIQLRRDRPAETRQSGIYVWHHPDWGYFYVGIAAADNFTERWNKHIQKLLDQCTSARQMANWRTFSQRFAQQGYGIDDLKDITLRFFPRPNPGSPTFKKELEDLETRIVGMINPMCNKEYNPDRPSATRIPPARVKEQQENISIMDMMRSIQRLEDDLRLKGHSMTRQDYYREKNRIGDLRKRLKQLVSQHQNTP